MTDQDLDVAELEKLAAETEAKKKPAAKKAAPKKKPAAKKAAAPRKGSLESQLKALIETVGTLVMAVDKFDGEVIHSQASDLATNLVTLANSNARVKAILDKMLATGAWSGVGMILGVQIVLPIAVHHGAGGPGIAAVFGIPQKERKAKPETGTVAAPDLADGEIDPEAAFTIDPDLVRGADD